MKSNLGFVLALALCALSIHGSTAAERPDLAGVVKDAEGQPLRDAVVFIYTAGPREGVGTLCPSCYADCRKRATTDADGRFKIESLDSTLLFRVLVVGKGHRPEFVTKVDPAEKPIEVALKLVTGGENPDQRLRGRVIDPEGKPVPGAVINIRGVSRGSGTRFGANPDIDPVAVTDDDGAFVIHGQNAFDAAGIDIEARALAKGIFQRLSTGDKVHELKLTEGVSVHGKVVKDGKPLPGAEIGIAGAERRSEIFVGDYSVATDKEGNFLFVNLPARTDYYVYGIVQSLGDKGTIPARRVKAGSDGTTLDLGELTLERGFTVEGQLKLTDGQALPEKTRVRLGRRDAWDSTEVEPDAQGRFRFTGIPAESVTLSARIKGYRLSLRNASMDPLNTMSLIGRVHTNITGLIVEFEPGERRERIDGDQNALREEPLRGAEFVPMTTGDIKVSGVVTDAETGKPLPSFSVTEGREDNFNRGFTWFAGRKTTHSNGAFTVYFTKQPKAPAVWIEADGYVPQSSGRIPGDTNITLSLKKGSGPNGIVLAPDGQPVADVKVYLTDMRNGVYVAGGTNLQVRDNIYRGTRTAQTDSEGRFKFSPQPDAYSVIVIADAGYAEVKLEDLAAAPEVRLQPWARVEGKLRIATQPGAKESVRLWPAHIPYQRESRSFDALSLHLEVTTGPDGEFVFGRVPPLAVEVYHSPKTKERNVGTTPMSQTTKLALKPGETREITLGGKGRAVIGRFVVNGYEGDIDWRADTQMMESVPPEPEDLPNLLAISREHSNALKAAETDEEKKALQAPYEKRRKEATEQLKRFYASEAGLAYHFAKKRYALNFAQDGTFRIEDVPSGKYTLKLDLREPTLDGPSRMSSPAIANTTKEIEVPETPGGRSDEPFDLGTIELQARPAMSAGKAAPDFEVKTLEGKTIKLSDFRGKYVLLDFWAVWCGPCVKETPFLKEAYAAFKDDPRFALIGLSLDPKESAPRDYAKKNELGWIQAFLGEWARSEVPARFGVTGIPSIMLIGPNGKVIASGLRGAGIKSAVATALKTKESQVATGAKSE